MPPVRKADILPPSCAVVMKSGYLNFLEPSGPVQDCNGTALPFYRWEDAGLVTRRWVGSVRCGSCPCPIPRPEESHQERERERERKYVFMCVCVCVCVWVWAGAAVTVYTRGSQPVIRGALRAPRALPRGSTAAFVLTISCVLVVVENKLRYYGKFQSF